MGLMLVSLVIASTTATFVALVALLIRTSKLSRDLVSDVRTELRTGREEGRSAARDLRDEVAASGRSMGDAQQRYIESVAGQLNHLAESKYNTAHALGQTLDP